MPRVSTAITHLHRRGTGLQVPSAGAVLVVVMNVGIRRLDSFGDGCLQADLAAVGISDQRLDHAPVLGAERLREVGDPVWGEGRRVGYPQDGMGLQVGV